MNTSYCAGIDVSKLNLDVHLRPDGPDAPAVTSPPKAGPKDVIRRVANTPTGHAELISLMRKHHVGLVVLEASGSYENLAKVALVNAGLRVHVAQPATVRHYAASMGLKAKNDKIDALVLACFAQERGSGIRVIDKIDKTHETLQALMARRDQLKEMHTMEENRLQQVTDKIALKSNKRFVALIKKELARVEKQIDAIIAADPVLQARSTKLQEVEGVGPQTARLLVACLPELGKSSLKQLNALVGVAPYDRESGEHKGTRAIAGGRKLVRNGLYMSCITAMTSNPVIAPYYKQLRSRGLAHKTAMMACIRKLLAYLDSLIRTLEQDPATGAL